MIDLKKMKRLKNKAMNTPRQRDLIHDPASITAVEDSWVELCDGIIDCDGHTDNAKFIEFAANNWELIIKEIETLRESKQDAERILRDVKKPPYKDSSLSSLSKNFQRGDPLSLGGG